MTDKQEYTLPDRLTVPPIKRLSYPRKMIFVDTESEKVNMGGRTIKHVLKLGHAIYWERESKKRKERIEHYEFTNGLDFWGWVTAKANKRETVYVFAHNITFDFLVLQGFQLLPALDFVLTSIYHKFTTTIMRFSCDNRRLVFGDTMNYFPVKLEELGKSVGLEKLSINLETTTDEELKTYCQRDTEIVYLTIRKLIETLQNNDLAPFRLSAPSLAHAIYRHKFMTHRIVTQHWREIVDFEREAYSGGYVQVMNLLERGHPEIVKLDVNSMYPSVMQEEKFPLYMTDFMTNPKIRHMEVFLKDYLIVANVTLSARSPHYLYRYASGHCYPTGEFTTTLTTPLLKRALENDEIVKVNKMAVYAKGAIFKEFVNFMYAQRQKALMDGDKTNALFYKKMANSLYGKFGQTATESKRIGDCPPDEFCFYDAQDAQTLHTWRELHAGGSVVFIYSKDEARYSFYAIAAHVVDYAKVKLFNLIAQAGTHNVFYTDTDSIITNRAGYAALSDQISDYALGKLKVEGRGLLYAGFSKKDYLLGGVRKLKGFPEQVTPPETNVFQMYTHSSIYGAAKRQLSGGAFWHEIVRRHNPYISNVTVDRMGKVTPIDMSKQGDMLGVKAFTRETIRGLSTYMLTKVERGLLSPWLEI